jgi:hypothetical protein
MKVALCFIISYDHILNKEKLWKKWIEPNKDIINVYFFYKDINKIKSEWILNHVIDKKYIVNTSYYHVVPAYMNLFYYAYHNDKNNRWFCILSDSCVPIISPTKFRKMFMKNYNYSIFSWKKAWWNIYLTNRANLRLFEEKYHLGNDPWFTLKREDVEKCFIYMETNFKLYKLMCDGGLANESIFAIILSCFNQLKYVKNEISTATDWSRMTSSTSPYLFRYASQENILFIQNFLKKNKYTMFLRKVSLEFSDEALLQIMDSHNNSDVIDINLNIDVDNEEMFWKKCGFLNYFISFLVFILFYFFYMLIH